MPRQLLRYSQVRRQDQVDVQVDDDRFQRGRYFHASCLAGDSINNFVYITGLAVGSIPVTTVDINNSVKMPSVGVLVEKDFPTVGLVQVEGIYTPGFAVVPQQLYWIGASGTAVSTAPLSPALKQTIGIGLDATSILLRPGLSDIFDVTADEHETLRQIIHLADGVGGPMEGWASGAYRETLPLGSPFPTTLIWWSDATKTSKIIQKSVVFNANKTPAVVSYAVYKHDGLTVIVTVTDTISYSGVFETFRTRTVV